ncbi:hypothetical protein PROFUN_16440 [Planoprotostelium fungivorum]|uniref:Uncharacterized protein n=1 Tax=Planoprotostelium fungivorum TaxID=1890364 RepID=A0A2P6MQ37_9EUKA|nr:hypothetical protein PROFUN_16440 [Planoprotostelium fungivorum]
MYKSGIYGSPIYLYLDQQICQFSSSFVRSIYILLLCKTTTIKWQFEFYCCAHAVVWGEHCVSSKYQIDKPIAVGEKRDRGSPPRLDFWINSTLKFGFELLVDGIGQGKHVSRPNKCPNYNSRSFWYKFPTFKKHAFFAETFCWLFP